MKDGAASSVDAAHGLAAELAAIFFNGKGIVGIDAEHALPAAPEAKHVPAEVAGRQGDRADAGVKARDVAAACQDAELHVLPFRFMLRPAAEAVQALRHGSGN